MRTNELTYQGHSGSLFVRYHWFYVNGTEYALKSTINGYSLVDSEKRPVDDPMIEARLTNYVNNQ